MIVVYISAILNTQSIGVILIGLIAILIVGFKSASIQIRIDVDKLIFPLRMNYYKSNSNHIIDINSIKSIDIFDESSTLRTFLPKSVEDYKYIIIYYNEVFTIQKMPYGIQWDFSRYLVMKGVKLTNFYLFKIRGYVFLLINLIVMNLAVIYFFFIFFIKIL